MKRTLSIVLTAIMVLVILAPSVYAMDKEDSSIGVKAYIEGYGSSADVENAKDSNVQIDIIYTPTSNLFIDRTVSTIHDIGRGFVSIEASTRTFSTVDRLSLTIYLERWNGSSWTTVNTWSSNRTNTNSIRYETASSVNRGDTYRVRISHVGVHNGKSESKQTITSYIMIP